MIAKIKTFIKNLIGKIKGKGEEEVPPKAEQLIIRTFKNGEKISYHKITNQETINQFCSVIQNFAKWEDYKIIYDYPGKAIQIYFTVKKAADFEDIKNKEEKK